MGDMSWRHWQDLGLQLLDEHDPAALVRRSLEALLTVVPGDVVGQIEVDLRGGGATVTEAPDLLLPTVKDPRTLAVLATHPALPHLRTQRQLGASRVEDLCGEQAWRRHPMRRHLLDPFGVPYALLCAHITSGGKVRGWGVNRDRPFSDAERDALAGFEPFLRRAAARADEQALVLDLDRAVSDGAGLVVLRRKTAVYMNAAAQELLESHRVTPSALERGLAGRAVDEVVVVATGRGALRLRLRPSSPGTLTVVLTAVEAVLPTGAPLTGRQQAVLCHLADGLTAEAIARQLRVSPRTVHKHLENLYRRLDARDRLDAVLRAQALGLLALCDARRSPLAAATG